MEIWKQTGSLFCFCSEEFKQKQKEETICSHLCQHFQMKKPTLFSSALTTVLSSHLNRDAA